MKEVILPSGAKLKISLATFKEGKELYQTVLAELKEVEFDREADFIDLIKNLSCVLLSSAKVEACIQKCFGRCTYNGLKISDETFESEEARGDFIRASFEVAQENIRPFAKSLSVESFQELSGLINGLR